MNPLFDTILSKAKEKLQKQFSEKGFYQGQLSSSALSTCLAVYSLWLEDPLSYQSIIQKGLSWLTENENPEGGWGDTIKSPSNLSTTLLVWSVFFAIQKKKHDRATLWLKTRIGSLDPQNIVSHVLEFYGKDRTFSAPILTCCMLSGSLGEKQELWHQIPQLPFELAAFPAKLFRLLGLQVVSYAIPALVAIGLVRHRLHPTPNKILRFVRCVVEKKVLKLLEKLQPPSGGFLEAIPLTAFVCMSLIKAGEKNSYVVKQAVAFLVSRARKDGSWAIDSNLNTWITSLALQALPQKDIPPHQKESLKSWLLNQQFQEKHPFTQSPPGGWGWTDLPGRLPDGDDTSGALLALHSLVEERQEVIMAIQKGIQWLLMLQNRDGGMPTFCKGWSKLPFDKSCPDITAHAMSAFLAWKKDMPGHLQKAMNRSLSKAISYLQKNQNAEGSWFPLWFGNALAADTQNPVYGTSKVVYALASLESDKAHTLWIKGCEWLASVQNEDGGWGGGQGIKSSIEETSLAIKALSTAKAKYQDSLHRGLEYLIEKTKQGESFEPSPIGLYFSQLWYFEEMYPVLFAISAMEEAKTSCCLA